MHARRKRNVNKKWDWKGFSAQLLPSFARVNPRVPWNHGPETGCDVREKFKFLKLNIFCNSFMTLKKYNCLQKIWEVSKLFNDWKIGSLFSFRSFKIFQNLEFFVFNLANYPDLIRNQRSVRKIEQKMSNLTLPTFFDYKFLKYPTILFTYFFYRHHSLGQKSGRPPSTGIYHLPFSQIQVLRIK